MNKLLRTTGLLLLAAALLLSLAACGQRTVETENTITTPTPTEETKEIVVETPPPSPTPTPTPTPSTPPVAVTTVPMPMPSVTPTVAITTTPDPNNPTATPGTTSSVASPTVSASPSPSASPTPTYSAEANFASTIQPDSVTVPDTAVAGYITVNGANLRGAPNTSGRVLGTMSLGTAVQILATEGNWTEVLVDEVVGYVLSDYVAKGTYSGTATVSGINTAGTIIVSDDSAAAPEASYFLGIMPD
ncbi:MAG: SH3 domain-containing protein [Oscillospiraceae bacterium]|nr:SH3 domain-containing protein [Oscillospiraceae bacterium]